MQQGGTFSGTARARPVLTSLTLQILLYFGGWWDAFYWIVSIAVFIYKGLTLPYPSSNYAVEFTFQWLYLLVEPVRIFLCSKGNKTEVAGPLMFSIFLAAPMVAFHAYYLQFETYVLKIDVVLNAVSLAFCGLQVMLGLLASVRFIQAAKFA